MATWVDAVRAAEFPDVVKVYGREGGGQGSTQSAGGTTPSHAPKGFLKTVKLAVQSGAALPAWIRKEPGAGPQGWQKAQVDVTGIPGVRKLRANGKWTGF